MKKLLFFTPFLAYAISFNQIKTDIVNSTTYQIESKKIKLLNAKLKTINNQKYGNLQINYTAIRFLTRPYIKTKVAVGVNNNQLIYQQMDINSADMNHFIAELSYSLPIFNKSLNMSIKKSKLELIKQKLELDNVKRVLFLKTLELYTNIYALDANIKSLQFSKKALLSAKEKSKSLYQAGLLDKANYDEIEAKYYEVIAQIENLKAKKDSLLDTLSYVLNKKIENIEGIYLDDTQINPNFLNRADVKVIKEILNISNQNIKLAKSTYYPQIGLKVGLKREGDNFDLSKNDYSNLDKSYVALEVSYKFDGSNKYKVQTAKIAKNINNLFFIDYLNKVKMEFNNDKRDKKALFAQLKYINHEIKARESFYSYIKAKFNEGLADATDLNNAIAKLAIAKSKKEYIKSKIFFLNEKMKIDGGVDVFSK